MLIPIIVYLFVLCLESFKLTMELKIFSSLYISDSALLDSILFLQSVVLYLSEGKYV